MLNDPVVRVTSTLNLIQSMILQINNVERMIDSMRFSVEVSLTTGSFNIVNL
jgi:hypothetical protein